MTPATYVPQARDVKVYRQILAGQPGTAQFSWIPLDRAGSAGISVEWLYTADRTTAGAEAYIARYAPGAHDEFHEHLGYELTLVLTGELRGDNGDVYQPGTLIVEHPGGSHQFSSVDGCVALTVREKGVRARTPGPGRL